MPSEIELTRYVGRDFTPTLHHDTYPLITPTISSARGLSVFITGASKGIGKATALSYAKAGASRIGLGARSSLKELEQEIAWTAEEVGNHDLKVLSVELDVSDRGNVEAAAKKVEKEWGSVDVLMNNAGYLEEWKAMGESDPAEWWKTWEVVR